MCDKTGHLNYVKLIKDFVIQTSTDFTGLLVAKWHIKQSVVV